MIPAPPPIRADLAQAAAHGARRRALVVVSLGASLMALGLAGLFLWRLVFADLPALPPTAALWSLNRAPGVTFLDRTGAVIAVRGVRHGAPVRLADLPPYVPQAFLAAEDRRFYHHPGVDAWGMARALVADLKASHAAQGGSTITQQLARALFLTPEPSFKRKAQEAVLALALERRLPKSAILELYLNRIYFGSGAYGLEAAARTYFGKPPRELTLAEAALLAALPKAPSRLDPNADLDAAQARARLVLGLMRHEGWIGAGAQAQGLAHPAVLAPETHVEGDYGYVLDAAAAGLRDLVQAQGLTLAPDLVVTLAVDPRLQPLAAQAVRDAVAQARPFGATQGALVALAPDGGVAALVGGVDHRASPFDRATKALRQPGSAFKPMVYAAALQGGVKPEDARVDAPIRYGTYAPRNFGGGYAGAVSVSDALARSINTVAVQLAHEAGVETVAALARRFGLSTIPERPALPVALGAYEVRLIDLVGAYQVFQAQGMRRAPHLIAQVATARGDVLWRWSDASGFRVYPADRAAEMTRMLEGVIGFGTGRRAQIGRPAAGKTGTTQNFRDAWFVGFTPDWAAGVWLGDDHGRPMPGLEGGKVPAAAWAKFMTAAHEGRPVREFSRPPGEADPRQAFYEELAEAFERAQREPPDP